LPAFYDGSRLENSHAIHIVFDNDGSLRRFASLPQSALAALALS